MFCSIFGLVHRCLSLASLQMSAFDKLTLCRHGEDRACSQCCLGHGTHDLSLEFLVT